MLITHDLGVMSSIAERMSVMYAGRVIECGDARDVLKAAAHPYTRALLSALPHPGAGADRPLVPIPGAAGRPLDPPPGCAFHPRCAFAAGQCRPRSRADRCWRRRPRLRPVPVDPWR